ncbi:sialate O-acetylesterase [Mariniflexile sp. AS56]|uniref:sialate O-acetylesterase n=1 Tax=Mariniflexile sp. AS56 TaxID=3063957 RepID=UPI0026E928C1|nr:sialate O-acetylesterase [Mariniflexile sp. AS56]MDO7171613.1 sialate O-acetylesterase [Mariniflexile sp. AS56]
MIKTPKNTLQRSGRTSILLVLFLSLITIGTAQQQAHFDKVEVASVFGSHMVLQQNEPITIWGNAPSETEIKVTLGTEKKETKTGESGKWQVVFKARKGSFYPLTLVVNNQKFEDILIGEVWVCSGQSNMQFQLKNMQGYNPIKKHIPNKNIRFLKHTNIRIVAKEGYTSEELARCNTQDFFKATWKENTIETASKNSAVASVFADGLFRKLNVPIGVIEVAVGGSALNNWIPKEALQSNPSTKNIFKKDWLKNEDIRSGHRTRAEQAFQKLRKPEDPYFAEQFKYRWMCEPSFLFEAGIAPLKQLAFRGVFWYQGEAETETINGVNTAKDLFPILINEWRSYLNMGDFPFIYVQLPGNESDFWPEFREVQRQTLSVVENANMVVSIDLGAEKNVHPKDKQPIGDRALRLALKNVYGFSEITGFPELEKWSLDENEITLFISEFGTGLHTLEDAINGFEIAGEDGVFYKADARIGNKNSLIVTSTIQKPKSLRYGWASFPKPALNVFNSEALPLGPFQIVLKD